jgi:hypothetical protein
MPLRVHESAGQQVLVLKPVHLAGKSAPAEEPLPVRKSEVPRLGPQDESVLRELLKPKHAHKPVFDPFPRVLK